MTEYTKIKNLSFLRSISSLLPLKHKLSFLINDYLKEDTDLAIRYFKNWHVCTKVSNINRSTIEEVILNGPNSQPEASLIRQMRNELPDDMVLVDVGGNIGTFLCQFLDKCKTVLVFEPIPRLNNVIKNSIEYNKDHKIQLIAKAVGDQPGSVKMLDNNNSNIVDNGNTTDVLNIEVTTLDNELSHLEKVDFIKIDVEGYELNVLKGARELIRKQRPVLFIEVHPMYLENYGQHFEGVIDFIENNNYTIQYFSFLQELRMSRIQRIFSRWKGTPGIRFTNKEDFLKDIYKEPRLGTYHFYCEPK